MLRPAPGPVTALWLWQDSYLALGALVFSAGRAANFLGLDDQAATLHALIQHLNSALPALRPTGGFSGEFWPHFRAGSGPT